MDLNLQGQQVTEQSFDYTVSFGTSGGFELRIEHDYTLRTSHGVLRFSPEPSNADSDDLQSLAEQVISKASTENDGTLIVRFASESELRAHPSRIYEAWTVAGPGGMKVVCMPGGDLAIWKANKA
ncbi:DUF6188 family protein [Saccharopolyspora sp. ASAGF58]|uniref:DUF6188 family protein n=1 Tax=Saccharopolyspora sp. ASAGF58 TaxID=2719023 RepID=UPI00143FD594|nr:DUF6188 family protein [Saccharopolyspora sp. ASAGF58]QIZ37428.1 hypothetical protein FDZ84_26085 [Saccharopolyspora sp. ASAGF58]